MGILSLLGMRVARRGVAACAFVVALAGCGDEAPPAPVAIDDLLSCDITQSACQRGIYDSVAEMLAADGFLMPRIRTISVEQHADEVRSGLDLEDLAGEDPRSRGLRLLGFIPEVSESLAATQAEYWINQVAAYYSRGSNSITVIDRDYDPGSAQVILAHEFIHAIQDNQFDLTQVSRDADTEDSVIGVRSVIEGDAVFSSFAWYYDVNGFAPSQINWDATLAERTVALRERVTDEEIPLIDTASSFPYVYGLQFMTRTSLAGGLPARAAAFESPPATTAEVLAGYGIPVPALDIPEVSHPAPLDGATLEVENRYGAWYVYGFLRRQGMSDEQALLAALSWVGDELSIYGDGTEVVAVWRVRFNNETTPSALATALSTQGGETARSAIAFGDDAFVFAAETAETLLAWAEQPLDEMTASIAVKAARRSGGAVSVGNCLQSWHFSVPREPVLLH